MSDQNTQPAEGSTPQAQNTNDLPDWGRKAISDANAEAASYRQKAKTAADEAKAEVTASFNDQIKTLSDEKSAISAERDSAASNYDRLVAALGAGVPGDTAVEFAALLQGSNAEEYKAHAEKLKGMFGTPGKQKAVDHTAGFNGDTNSSPDEVFAAIFNRNLSR